MQGDLACRNILVFRFDEQEPKNSLVEVTDFGLSRASSIYSSILIREAYSKGTMPWADVHDEKDVIQKVINEERSLQPKICNEEMLSLILSTMKHQPSDRPSFASLNVC
ncbi:unnamed protein product [Didymodactylos carnosus]|uniref:Serine-threonine/tyrosine-protein kinase catalytic domain-containing protein n=1 Tax=Didymodactylos carnosus TaxID=1234261 RepID=A0A814XW15_9BILA|nr:unnamed protein product [Didymodactylos carnosus]CAF3984475.1 unnamed protein product [Didymodactylos carnosus]